MKKKKSRQFIADKLDRSKSSVVDEINRNSVNGIYTAKKANHKAYVRRRESKYQGLKIRNDKELENYIIRGLKKGWSPDEISGRMKKERGLSKKNDGFGYPFGVQAPALKNI